MSARKTMTIIVLPNIKMFHFTEKTLVGIRNEAWYPYSEGRLFEYVEKYLVDAGVAHNITRLDERQRCGQSVDYVVTYNVAKPTDRKGNFNHAFDIAFEVVSDNNGDNVTGAELRAGLLRRLLITSDEELEEACGKPHDTFETNIN
ncbi:hypothetical protein NQT65_19170 [Pseudoalteromonas agarivorans]|uniref:hypothetical protein n=1 Tax=Pseudoalteromonas agarivorans TaxID=176102 RepID=UPI002118AF70|nr:hypothetical protein [Pseudoalteromonas agarivorans]MCQ8822316.1 hypothetical protein [Pseudoalteromonas agarivorans]